MSNTIAHRPHAHHMPWIPTVLAVIVAIIIAAAIIYAVNQPGTTTTTTTATEVVAPVTGVILPTAVGDDSIVRHRMAAWYASHPEQMKFHLWELQRHMTLDSQSLVVFPTYERPSTPR